MASSDTAPETELAAVPGRLPRGRTDGRGAGVAAAVALGGDLADELVLRTVREVHQAVATRVFAITNRVTRGAARTPQALYEGVSAGVYAGVGAALRGGSSALRAVERKGLGPRLETSRAGRHVLSAVNGVVGDRLKEQRPELAIAMSVRVDGSDVPLTPQSLRTAFPAATGEVAVFVHGLGENDDFWNYRRAELGSTYGTRLAERTSWTPVYIRANTGLPLAENGRELAALMERLVAAWPTTVRRVALVGHSMGGLIVRAACAQDPAAQDPTARDPTAQDPTAQDPTAGEHPHPPAWTDLVTDVVTLGTPHLGAPLEHVAHAGARALGVLPESAPFGRVLEYRSVGILDLRRGLAADVQHLPHARYRLVAATLARSRRHPVSATLGDLLVLYPSAVGRARRGAPMFPDGEVLHVPGADHFALLNHPDVADALERWLQ